METGLKPEKCFFAENVSCGRRVAPPNVLYKFACGANLERTVNRIISVKPIILSAVDGSFHDVKTAWKAVFSRVSLLSFPQQNIFSAILPPGKIAADGEIVKSIKIIFPVRRPKNPRKCSENWRRSKALVYFFAENVSCGLRVAPPNVLCKLEADSKPNYVRKADFSYPQECKPAINSVFYKKKCDYFVGFCFLPLVRLINGKQTNKKRYKMKSLSDVYGKAESKTALRFSTKAAALICAAAIPFAISSPFPCHLHRFMTGS